MRMMLKGDLAFFYHSNCKIPGIVGIMEIVQEHTPDGKEKFSLTQLVIIPCSHSSHVHPIFLYRNSSLPLSTYSDLPIPLFSNHTPSL